LKKRVIPFDKKTLIENSEEFFSKEIWREDLREKLEEEFSNYASSEYLLPVNNFTASLHLSMCALDLKRGDKIICSVNSAPEIPEVVRHFDSEPIFIDVAEDSYHMDLKKLEATVMSYKSKKLKAIIVSHIGGDPIDMKELRRIADIRKLAIVEDATNTIGIDREELDSLSDIRLFSLDTKISSTGLIATDNEEYFERASILSHHGMVFDDESSVDYIYDVIDVGCQYDANSIDLKYSTLMLESGTDDLRIRRDIAKKYISALKGIPHLEIKDYNPNHTYTQFIIKIDKNRDGFARELKSVGIETKLHYIPLHLLSYYKQKYNLKINSYPNALKHFQHILSIPIHSDLSNEDVDYVIENIKRVANTRV
jgi:perosamine synthetase